MWSYYSGPVIEPGPDADPIEGIEHAVIASMAPGEDSVAALTATVGVFSLEDATAAAAGFQFSIGSEAAAAAAPPVVMRRKYVQMAIPPARHRLTRLPILPDGYKPDKSVDYGHERPRPRRMPHAPYTTTPVSPVGLSTDEFLTAVGVSSRELLKRWELLMWKPENDPLFRALVRRVGYELFVGEITHSRCEADGHTMDFEHGISELEANLTVGFSQSLPNRVLRAIVAYSIALHDSWIAAADDPKLDEEHIVAETGRRWGRRHPGGQLEFQDTFRSDQSSMKQSAAYADLFSYEGATVSHPVCQWVTEPMTPGNILAIRMGKDQALELAETLRAEREFMRGTLRVQESVKRGERLLYRVLDLTLSSEFELTTGLYPADYNPRGGRRVTFADARISWEEALSYGRTGGSDWSPRSELAEAARMCERAVLSTLRPDEVERVMWYRELAKYTARVDRHQPLNLFPVIVAAYDASPPLPAFTVTAKIGRAGNDTHDDATASSLRAEEFAASKRWMDAMQAKAMAGIASVADEVVVVLVDGTRTFQIPQTVMTLTTTTNGNGASSDSLVMEGNWVVRTLADADAALNCKRAKGDVMSIYCSTHGFVDRDPFPVDLKLNVASSETLFDLPGYWPVITGSGFVVRLG